MKKKYIKKKRAIKEIWIDNKVRSKDHRTKSYLQQNMLCII